MKLEDLLLTILEKLEGIEARLDVLQEILLGEDDLPSVSVEVLDMEAPTVAVDSSVELCATLEVDFGGWQF